MGWRCCLSSGTRERVNYGEINDKSKQQKPNEDVDLNVIEAAVGVQNEDSPAPILKLHAICCDDLFEWLSFEDLHSLGQTCKRMHQLTGLYFQENFKHTLHCRDQSIYYENIQFNGFIKFVQNIKIYGRKSEHFQYIGSNCDSLREIIISSQLTARKINLIKDKLNKVERIELWDVGAKSINLYKDLLTFCPNLKNLMVNCRKQYGLICHKYPKLEYLRILNRNYPFSQNIGQNIGIFFQQNPQLQRFECDSLFLLDNSETIIDSMMKLDRLTIELTFERPDIDEEGELCILLNKLYDNHFYKRIEIKYLICSQLNINRISKLRRLEKLLGLFLDNVVFPSIFSLEELYICTSYDCPKIDYSAMAVAFPNLRVVHSDEKEEVDRLLPLIQRLPKLKELYFPCLTERSNGFQIDLSTWNEERNKLSGACKLAIYVPENIYLETKMAPKNLYINYDSIEIKRGYINNQSHSRDDSQIFK